MPAYVLTEPMIARLQLKKTEPARPSAQPSRTGHLARYAVTRAALAYFFHLAAETLRHGGAPLIGERVCTTGHEAWYLEQITAAGLVLAEAEASGTWITMTKAGIKLAAVVGINLTCCVETPQR